MEHDDRGYIVVETIGCFILFVFLNASILSLINIVTVQARIHYALTQAAETLSMYSYTLDALGVADHFVNMAERAEGVQEDTNELISNINSVMEAINGLNLEQAKSSGEATYNQVNGFVNRVQDDPMDVLQDFMSFGLYKTGNAALMELVSPLVGRYLSNGELSGDEFLRAFHVIDGLKGLDFYKVDLVSYDTETGQITKLANNDSVLLDSSGNVRLIVQYDIDYTFGALPLPFGKLHVTQEVMTKAWLNGKGDGYHG